MSLVKRTTKPPLDFIIWESDGNVCRDNCTLAEGQVLQAATVLEGPDNALVAYDQGPATGILCYGTDTSEGAVEVVKLARGPCEVGESRLTWQSGTPDADKIAAYADLKALGIVVRKSGDGTVVGDW